MAGSDTWRVVSWNVWWRFGDQPERRLAAARSVLVDLGADVLCLQEVYRDESGQDDAAGLAGALSVEAVQTEPAFYGGRAFGNAILSRWPVVEHGEEALPEVDGTPGHRRALWAVLSAPFGRLPVICTHLAYRFDQSAVRQRQVAALARLAATLRADDPESSPPVVLAGDLNAVPDSDELRLLTGRSPAPVPGLVFTDCWPQVRDDPGHTWVRRKPYLAEATWPQRRLDYVMLSWPRAKPLGHPVAGFLVGDGPVDGVWPSDHLGVGFDLVGATAAPT